jgi:hypothetical protein
MEAKIIYKKGTPADRDIEWITRKLDEVRAPYRLIDADSREGAALTELYDMLDRPVIIVTRSDGSLVASWQGSLPPVQDITNAMHTI